MYWSLANEQALLLQVLQRNDPTAHGMELQQVYWQMARQLHEEGRSYRRNMQQAHEARLIWEQAKIENMVGSEVADWRTGIMANACCDVCQTLDSHTYTFDEAIKEMPLPPEDCTHGWCNCGWINVPPPI